ncbi:MAG: MBL fold metallo-hydrolase [Deltaproteobacteria bacterium]|nr:MBL fold metallo-hydrolase [Deltaproteobacteria bacterium]
MADTAIREESVTIDGARFEWLAQSTVRVRFADGFIVYFDPIRLDTAPPLADLILITHHHVDHCLPEFIVPIRGPKTQVAAFHDSYVKYCVKDIKGVRTVKTGQTVTLGEARITGIDAYTRRGFHSKGEGCGFILEYKGVTVYFSGDTSRIDEMGQLGRVDVAIMPIADNTYTIDAMDMVEAVKTIKPRLFIPVHFTPEDEPDPVVKEGMFSTKDIRFFTRKADPAALLPCFEGTGIKMVMLRKLTKPGE